MTIIESARDAGTPVVAKPHPEGPWVVHEPIRIRDGYRIWRIPAGFETDLASVPRPLRFFIDESELGLLPAIAHDFLYRRGGRVGGYRYTRTDADRLFNDLMKSERVVTWKRIAAHRAVRLFGFLAWKEQHAY